MSRNYLSELGMSDADEMDEYMGLAEDIFYAAHEFAVQHCEEVLDNGENSLTMQWSGEDFADYVSDNFWDNISSAKDCGICNYGIDVAFSNLKDVLEDSPLLKELGINEVGFSVNAIDCHLYIGNEEIYDCDDFTDIAIKAYKERLSDVYVQYAEEVYNGERYNDFIDDLSDKIEDVVEEFYDSIKYDDLTEATTAIVDRKAFFDGSCPQLAEQIKDDLERLYEKYEQNKELEQEG